MKNSSNYSVSKLEKFQRINLNRMIKKIIVSILCSLMFIGAFAQNKPKSKKAEDVYHWRIQQEELDGVYIPKDLAECFIELDKKVTANSKAKFKEVDEKLAMQKLHYSLGRWIWYNWGLYEGSRLSVYMNKVGVNHPEDMADFIVVAYHRHLNKKPLEAKELVEFFQERRKTEKEEREKEREAKERQNQGKQ